MRARGTLREWLRGRWGRLFARRTLRESSPHPFKALKQENERIVQELRELTSKEAEHEKEREELKKIWREVEEELSAIEKSVDDIPSERTKTLAARSQELDERLDAFQKREEEIRQEATSLLEASKKLSERLTEIESQSSAANLEFEKMFFEVFKLVATLDTGVLIAMTAIAVGLIPNPGSLQLFFVSCALVFLSLVCSVTVSIAQALRTARVIYPIGSSIFSGWSFMNCCYWGSLVGSISGLTLGIGLFARFVILNLN
jgi:hypothetical protein